MRDKFSWQISPGREVGGFSSGRVGDREGGRERVNRDTARLSRLHASVKVANLN